MLNLPPFTGMIIDFFSVFLLFLIVLNVTPNIKTRLNISLAFTASVLFSFIDLKFNSASDLLTPLIYLFCFQFPIKKSFLKRISFFAVSASIFYFSLSCAAFFSLQIIPSNHLNQFHGYLYFSILDICSMYLLAGIIIKIEQTLFTKISRKFNLKDKLIEKIVSFTALILATGIIFVIFSTRILRLSTTMLIINLGILLLLVVLVFTGFVLYTTSYIQRQKIDQESKIVKTSENYIEALREQNVRLLRAKHDYKNILLALSAALDENNDQNQKTINNILNQADINTSPTGLDNQALYNIKNHLVRGIIVTKLVAAEEQNITTSVEIDKEVSGLNNAEYSLTRILGIIFDNAIEETTKAAKPTINFALINTQDYCEFIIVNSMQAESVNISPLFTAGYTSKPNHLGVGLSNIQDIVNTNEHFYLKVQADNYQFKVILTYEKAI